MNVVSVYTYSAQDSLNSHWALNQFLFQVWVSDSTAGLLCSICSVYSLGLTLMPVLFRLQHFDCLQDWAGDTKPASMSLDYIFLLTTREVNQTNVIVM